MKLIGSLLFFAGAVVALALYFGRQQPLSGTVTRQSATPPKRTASPMPEHTQGVATPTVTSISAGQSLPNHEDARTGDDEAASLLLASIMSAYPQLELSSEERQRLTETVLAFQEVYAEVVKSKLREQSFDGEKLVMAIAPFPTEGKELRDKLHAELVKEFGQERYEQIDDYLGTALDETFRGFGITAQTLEIARTPSGRFRISWSAEVVDNLTPSRVPETNPWVASTGTATLTLAQIQTGPYRYLAPELERRYRKTG